MISKLPGLSGREYVMAPPEYIKILKLDKLALKSKTKLEYLESAQSRLQYAKNLGVEESFEFFVEQAWLIFGTGK
jgi:hypothetical protein